MVTVEVASWEENYNIHICSECHTTYDQWEVDAPYVKGTAVCPKCGSSNKEPKENGEG